MKFSCTEFAIVFPTLNSPMRYLDIKNATKLKNAAHATACNGVSTLVEITAAIEFAES